MIKKAIIYSFSVALTFMLLSFLYSATVSPEYLSAGTWWADFTARLLPTADFDKDGLKNYEELRYGTDVYRADTDNDGMHDKWEIDNNLNPNDSSDKTMTQDCEYEWQCNYYICSNNKWEREFTAVGGTKEETMDKTMKRSSDSACIKFICQSKLIGVAPWCPDIKDVDIGCICNGTVTTTWEIDIDRYNNCSGKSWGKDTEISDIDCKGWLGLIKNDGFYAFRRQNVNILDEMGCPESCSCACGPVNGDNGSDDNGDGNGSGLDSDGDDIPDNVEGTDDTDGDRIPDYLDIDSDGDGKSDREEGTGDEDGDGIPNYKDPDDKTGCSCEEDGRIYCGDNPPIDCLELARKAGGKNALSACCDSTFSNCPIVAPSDIPLGCAICFMMVNQPPFEWVENGRFGKCDGRQ